MKRIVYKNNEGGFSIIIPFLGCGLSIEEIAKKDVPSGVPYKIIDTDDIPQDRTFRDAWEADMSDPHGVGADYGAGSDFDVIGWSDNGDPILSGVM